MVQTMTADSRWQEHRHNLRRDRYKPYIHSNPRRKAIRNCSIGMPSLTPIAKAFRAQLIGGASEQVKF